METTITEMHLGMMDEKKAAEMKSWLERINCQMILISEGYYLVCFPEGMTEEAIKPHPQYQQESIITLRSGTKLRKVQHWPCIHVGCTHVDLLPIGKPQEDEQKSFGAKRRRT